MALSLFSGILGIVQPPDSKMAQSHSAFPVFRSLVKTLAKDMQGRKEMERRRLFGIAKAENYKWRQQYVFKICVFKLP